MSGHFCFGGGDDDQQASNQDVSNDEVYVGADPILYESHSDTSIKERTLSAAPTDFLNESRMTSSNCPSIYDKSGTNQISMTDLNDAPDSSVSHSSKSKEE